MRVELHHGAVSDVGHVRTVNEDALLAAPPVFVVADGMGGHSGGDVASGIVVEELAVLADTRHTARSGAQAVTDLFARCQQRINAYGVGQRLAGDHGWYAGTTAVVALLVHDESQGHRWLLANLGDSRVYRLDEGTLTQVSVDHSVVQELVDAGRITPAEAHAHPERHVVTRALGGPSSPEPDLFLVPIASAERLLLCSDGINGMIGDEEIAAVLRATSDPRDAADRLVGAALAAGGRDNATALVVDVVGLQRTPDREDAALRVSLEQKLGALP